MSGGRGALLFAGGPIYPMRGPAPGPDGVLLVERGRVAYVGPRRDLEPGRIARAEEVELGGRPLLPGLCDSHLHLTLAAGQHAGLDLRGAASLGEVQRLVGDRARGLGPDTWVVGHGWEQRLLCSDRPSRPTDLDEATAGRPVFLVSKDWHSAWLNSAAMRRVEALDRMPGKCQVQRRGGRATGLVVEDVFALRDALVPPLSDRQKLSSIGPYVRRLWARGITTVHTQEAPEDLPLVRRALEDDGPRVRAVCNLIPTSPGAARQCAPLFDTAVPGWLATGGIKIFLDGTFGTLSAAVSEPYTDTDRRGLLLLHGDELDQWLDVAADVGVPVVAHAVGDRAVATFLHAVGGRRWPHRTAHRVEHAQLLSDALARDVGRSGVLFSMQPSHMWDDRGIVERHLNGDNGRRWAYAMRTLIDAGASLLFGSDAPVEDPDPWRGIQAAVTRLARGSTPPWIPRQRLTVAQALAAHTAGPTAVHGGTLGSGVLAPGRPADLVVLNRDPFALDRSELQKLHHLVRTDATYLDGELVYQRHG